MYRIRAAHIRIYVCVCAAVNGGKKKRHIDLFYKSDMFQLVMLVK